MSDMKHILFVDDETSVHTIVQLLFKRPIKEKSICLHFAKSVDEALNILNSETGNSITSVFTDINMPGKDGFELVKSIKSNERLNHLKVFVVTGYDLEEYKEKSLKLGSDGFFPKPMDIKAIYKALEL